jgi:hypothetical protein
MKTDPEISPLLERIQKAIRRGAKAAKDLAEAQRDLAQLQQKIDEIGEVDYRDDAKIALLSASRTKSELCTAAIARLQEKLDGDAAENAALLNQGCNLAQRVLEPILDRRRETIAAVVRPFCDSDSTAIYIAQQTSSYFSAYGAIAGFSIRASQAGNSDPKRILGELARIEEVLKEAAKGDNGDLMQFLSASPAAPTASDESDTPAADAGDPHPAEAASKT